MSVCSSGGSDNYSDYVYGVAGMDHYDKKFVM